VESHFARMSKDLDKRAIFCGALDALTFQVPFRRRAIWAKIVGWHGLGPGPKCSAGTLGVE